ncbi:adaptin N terminal region-domain-containing protein [Armillaria fumosa]|nr:adaptin N terminal region-domain-containing protein [Armillaria fumosa]
MGGAIPAGVYAVSGAVAGVAAWTARRFGGDEPDPILIRRQLDSGSDEERLGAMRTLIALMNNGRDVSEYFPQVVENVTSQISEIRKLVYLYLVRYAEQEPELSLRFINAFQRDLNDSDPFIQDMALRVLRGIRAPTTGNTVVLEEI